MTRARKVRIGRRPILKLAAQEMIPNEREECKAFWAYLQIKLRLGMSVFHVPNEGFRDSWYVKALKLIGLTPGVSDYIFLIPNQKYHGLIIEMKRKDGREKEKNAEQDAFLENCRKNGYYSSYAYGCDEAIKIYMDYVNNRL